MGGRAAAMRSCSGKLWRGGAQLTCCCCRQPALGANRRGVPRSATFFGGYVTVRAQPHSREWALYGGLQAAPRSTNVRGRGRYRKWQHDHKTCRMRYLWEGGRAVTNGRGVPATSGASIAPSSWGGARLWHRRRRRRPSCFPVLPVLFAGASAVSGRERPRSRPPLRPLLWSL